MARDSVFTDTTFHPDLIEFIASLIDRNTSFIVVHTRQNQRNILAIQTTILDATHEMVKVGKRGDVVVVNFKLDIGIDLFQSTFGSFNLKGQFKESNEKMARTTTRKKKRADLGQALLMRLEKQAENRKRRLKEQLAKKEGTNKEPTDSYWRARLCRNQRE
jgi:hypothetical protein